MRRARCRTLQDARFRYLFVLDDFTASGTSLLRKPGDKWKGKLVRLWNSLERAKTDLNEDPLEEGWTLYVHHYLATPRAVDTVKAESGGGYRRHVSD